jgi:hypothetical protein
MAMTAPDAGVTSSIVVQAMTAGCSDEGRGRRQRTPSRVPVCRLVCRSRTSPSVRKGSLASAWGCRPAILYDRGHPWTTSRRTVDRRVIGSSPLGGASPQVSDHVDLRSSTIWCGYSSRTPEVRARGQVLRPAGVRYSLPTDPTAGRCAWRRCRLPGSAPGHCNSAAKGGGSEAALKGCCSLGVGGLAAEVDVLGQAGAAVAEVVGDLPGGQAGQSGAGLDVERLVAPRQCSAAPRQAACRGRGPTSKRAGTATVDGVRNP